MVSPVTDPDLLAQLNGDSAPVTDPALLAQLNGEPQQPTNTFGQEAKRQGLLATRAILNAAASPAVLLDKVQAKASDALTGKHIGGTLGEDLNARLTSLGLPEAERPLEHFTQGMAETAPAFALPTSLLPQVAGNAVISATQAKPGEEGRDAITGGVTGAFAPVLGKAMKLLGHAGSEVLGTTTGAGGESVRQAYRNAHGFVENMRGSVNAGSVVEQARQGLSNMRQTMYDNYSKAKGGWAGDTTPLDFRPIGQAYNAAAAKFSFKGTPQPGVEGVKAQTEQVLNDWLQKAQQDPSFLTVEGLDALKRHLSTITPADVTNRAGRAFVTEVVSSVKDAIIKQRPDYAKAMNNYWRATEQLDEIAKSLSLGDRASIDTALRKLQSLTRNNVSSNYGARLNSAEALATQGGQDVMPAVAGQAMNSWTPRGLQSAVATGGGGIAALLNPWALGALPAFSPRMVGEAARGAGIGARNLEVQSLVEALRRTTPAALRSINNGNNE